MFKTLLLASALMAATPNTAMVPATACSCCEQGCAQSCCTDCGPAKAHEAKAADCGCCTCACC